MINMPVLLQKPKPYTSSKIRTCAHCLRTLNVKGFTSHERACARRAEAAKRDRIYENRILRERIQHLRSQGHSIESTPSLLGTDADAENDEPHETNEGDTHENSGEDDVDWFNDDEYYAPDEEAEFQPELDDIKIEYHSHSRRKPETFRFHEFSRARAEADLPPEDEPWRPFRCRADFEFASVAMEAALKREHINKLIAIIENVAHGTTFTLSGDRDLARLWKKASCRLTPFKKKKISVKYKKETLEYPVWLRPLWDWTLDLLMDDRLAPHFHWDAERLYKYDGSSFVRFIDEPWTAERFWQVQSNLPEGAHPFCWVLHADKNKLSSFGTEKGHPVIARCANLPKDIRNGIGIGGGRIVGWLPIVKDESVNKGKLSWRNHKRAVYHEAFREILKSLKLFSKVGYSFVDANEVQRRIYPCILILSADYEEQIDMLLNRGLKGLSPCPVCLTPSDLLSDLTLTHELRTQKKTKALLKEVKGLTADLREEKLMKHGLRNIPNAFWSIRNSDPHKAISWDRLHSYSSGLFGAHIWHNIQLCFTLLGRDAQEKFDDQIGMIPRFRGLHHFSEALHITFNDGSKFEDLAKQTLFAAHNVLTQIKSPHGYILLRCLRSFLILDTYLSFEVHTYATISSGERELRNFSALIVEYVKALPITTRLKFTFNWDFIKMHSHKHAFADIRAKGATMNYNTKPNEKLHKPLRDAYHLRTNFKHVAEQILKYDHYLLVASLIKSKVQDLDNYLAENQHRLDAESAGPATLQQYNFASPLKKITFSSLEQDHSSNPAFSGFRNKFAKYLTNLLSAHLIPLPNNRRITLSAEDKVIPYRLMKVTYENMVTWKASTDYLRCHPNFHGRPRYDSVIFRTVNGDLFGRLLFLFNYILDGKDYPTALIQPCDAQVGHTREADIDLGLTRVKAKPKASSEFISVRTIVRGAVLVPDFDRDEEYVVMDVLDADMFLRVNNMKVST